MSVSLEGLARGPDPGAPQRRGRAVQYPRPAPEVNRAAGGCLLHLVAEGNLESGRSVPLDVDGGWAPGHLVALEASRFPPRFLALLLAHPRRRLVPLLPDDVERNTRAEKRGRRESGAAAAAGHCVPAAPFQGISRDLHHCGCLHESADFHAPNVATAAAGGSVLRQGASPIVRAYSQRTGRRISAPVPSCRTTSASPTKPFTLQRS